MDKTKKSILAEKMVKGFRYQIRRAANKFVIVKFSIKLSEADFIETPAEFSDETTAREAFEKIL